MAPTGQFTDQSQQYYSGSNHSSPGMAFTNPALPSDSSSPPGRSRQQHHSFLVPVPVARSRSLSDTSLRPPVWDTAPMSQSNNMVSTVNMNDVLPAPGSSSPSPSPMPAHRMASSAGPHHSSFAQGPSHSRHYSSPNALLSAQQPRMNLDYLTPDIGATSLRRAKSDGMRAPGFSHSRQARSEDLTHSFSPSLAATTGSFPPPGQSTQEFLSRQYLHPAQSVIPSISVRGHHRRSSSGSRERPMGWQSGGSSARASPYPSPSASPRPLYPSLPGGPELGMGIPPQRRPMGVDMGGMPMNLMDHNMTMTVNATGEHMTVTKINVTTPSTADASRQRRKQPANFQCPVPGCGSTFTRHFNLKGHLRSHAEEKPYQCKWPGCGKGFARQHDCKRHEQLHLNIRPYPCEGCKKNFARMDALNRHRTFALPIPFNPV